VHEAFRKFAKRCSETVGVARGVPGGRRAHCDLGRPRPQIIYSDTWQLVINTMTTIITFIMVFIVQNTQNRDARAIQLKLDELIRAVQRAGPGWFGSRN
jgi:low affinity Fe/Cu permease